MAIGSAQVTSNAMPRWVCVMLAMVVALAAVCESADAQRSRRSSRTSRNEPGLVEAVIAERDAILKRAVESDDIATAMTDMKALLDGVITHTQRPDERAIVEAEYGVRVLTLIDDAKLDLDAGEALGELLDHPAFLASLAYVYLPEKDKAGGVVALARRLASERPANELERFAELASAVCVVHDAPWSMQINENRVEPIDPVLIYRYYATNARAMALDPSRASADLLVHVVNTTASVDDMTWALRSYNAKADPGDLFFTINYDDQHLYHGKTKKVTELGDYSLEAIRRYGGVCADQAYFATTVGKSVGIPTAYVTASGASMAHAWVGYVDFRKGRRAGWDFDAGRYEDYENIAGEVRDPQTGGRISDSILSLSGSALRTTTADRNTSRALTWAVLRMGERRHTNEGQAPMPAALEAFTVPAEKRRPATVEAELAILEEAVKLDPVSRIGWGALITLAEAGDLSEDVLERWSQTLDRVCGRDAPDMMFNVYSYLFKTFDDADRRAELWWWSADRFGDRPDLASRAYMEQAEAYADADRLDMAWGAYQQVVSRYANESTAVVRAAYSLEKLCREHGKEDAIVPMYEEVFGRIQRPGRLGFGKTQSNWYRVGSRLARVADEFGASAVAAKVRRDLNSLD